MAAMDAVTHHKAFRLGKWHVEPMLSRLSCAEEIVRIEPQNMKLLLRLAAEPGSVVSLEEIEGTVWRGLVVTPNSVYQSVAQLRRALGDNKANPIYIETVPRKGYRLVAPVGQEPEPIIAAADEAPPVDEISEIYEIPVIYEMPRVHDIPEIDAAVEPIVVPAMRGPQRSRQWLMGIFGAALVIVLGLTFYFYPTWRISPAVIATKSGPLSSNSSVQLAPEKSGPVAYANLIAQLGDEAMRIGQKERGRLYYEEALVLQRQASDKPNANVAAILTRLANVDYWNSDYTSAEAKAREAVQMFEQSGTSLHPYAPSAYDVLANILISSENYTAADVPARRSLETSKLLYGRLNPRTIDAQGTLILLRLAEGRFDEAEVWGRQALADSIELNGGTSTGVVFYHSSLALVLYKKARYADAAAEATKALEMLAQINLQDHPYAASARHLIGDSLIMLEKYAEAERVVLAELRALEALQDPQANRWRIARAMSALGAARLGQGRIQEAETDLMFASRELAGVKGWFENDARLATEERIQWLQQVKAQTLLTKTARSK